MNPRHRVIKEVSGVNGEKIVLLDWEGRPPKFVNMQKVDSEGKVIWTAQPRHPLEGVWTDMSVQLDAIRAHNFAGFSDTIDYQTGHVVGREFVK